MGSLTEIPLSMRRQVGGSWGFNHPGYKSSFNIHNWWLVNFEVQVQTVCKVCHMALETSK